MSQPVVVRGLAAMNYLARFLLDPIAALRRGYERFGPFAILYSPLQFVHFQKTVVVLAVGANFNREVLRNHTIWRTAAVSPGGPKNSASRRLSAGIFRMQGREHEYTRRALLPPLQRRNVDARGEQLTRFAEEEVASWPVNETIDLWECSRRMFRALAIAMLFGNDRVHGLPVAEMNYRWWLNTWSLKVNLCPVSVSGAPFDRMLRDAELLEHGAQEWAACVGGDPDKDNLLSLLALTPDENGELRSNSQIAVQIPSTG